MKEVNSLSRQEVEEKNERSGDKQNSCCYIVKN